MKPYRSSDSPPGSHLPVSDSKMYCKTIYASLLKLSLTSQMIVSEKVLVITDDEQRDNQAKTDVFL